MSTSRRQVADQLCDDAHALLAGASPHGIIHYLEIRMEDLAEIADDEAAADKKSDKEKTADAVPA